MIIISPLISLMEDQRIKLKEIGIKCSALHCNNKNKDNEIFDIIDGKIKIVYMSPEYLLSGGMDLASSLQEANKLGFLAIDEAHCISSWGHDFRPEYKKIKDFREKFPEINIIALTATATETVCDDIASSLNLSGAKVVRADFDRPNLYITVKTVPKISIGKKEKNMPREDIIRPLLEKYKDDKMIIYVGSRKDTEELSASLNLIKPNCSVAYHAGLTKKQRDQTQMDFSTGEVKIIVSTIAFGMGIDQLVKCVVIFGCPSSIEEYYQQIGRGGRDGLPCETIFYWDYSQFVIAKYMLKDLKRYPVLYKVKESNLFRVSDFAYIITCRRKYILEYFGQETEFVTCNNCDNCCEQKLIDMTEKWFNIIMDKKLSIFQVTSKITDTWIKPIDKKVNLSSLLMSWRKIVTKNNYTLKNLPKKLRLKVPNIIIEKQKDIKDMSYDEQMDLYQKINIKI
jgi:RecQ family ATP-dependent DNA helicase